MKRSIWVVIIALLSGCSMSTTTTLPATRPADFAFTYNWIAGSMPPPYHYEYTLKLSDGVVAISYLPSYPGGDVPTWTETVTPDPAAVEAVYQQVVQRNVLTRTWKAEARPRVGGTQQNLQVTAAGRSARVPNGIADNDADAIEPVYLAIQALVPQTTWDELDERQRAYHIANGLQP